MSALNYDDLISGTIAILRNDARLEDVHISDEPEDPTAEQCPAILVDMGGFSRIPKRICAGFRNASPYDETPRLRLRCWAFSANGAADARRQRHTLVRTVIDVIADNYTLGGRVLLAHVLEGDFDARPANGGGIFAAAGLSVDVLVQS